MGKKNIEGEPPYKPVLHHLMDVAAVALQWYRLNPSRLKREAALLQVSPEQLSTVSAFLAGLHDLGKFFERFSDQGTGIMAHSNIGCEETGSRSGALA